MAHIIRENAGKEFKMISELFIIKNVDVLLCFSFPISLYVLLQAYTLEFIKTLNQMCGYWIAFVKILNRKLIVSTK